MKTAIHSLAFAALTALASVGVSSCAAPPSAVEDSNRSAPATGAPHETEVTTGVAHVTSTPPAPTLPSRSSSGPTAAASGAPTRERPVRDSMTLAGASNTSTLTSNQMLMAGQSLVSPGCSYHLDMQGDGNLLYQGPGTANVRWATGTNGQPGAALIMQSDGNLVLYQSNNWPSIYPLWSTKTDGKSGDYLSLQDDGNLVVYQGSTPLWASNTSGESFGQTCGLHSSITHMETGYLPTGFISKVTPQVTLTQCASELGPACKAVIFDGRMLLSGNCSCVARLGGWQPSTARTSFWTSN
jgi:hypothetical protein